MGVRGLKSFLEYKNQTRTIDIGHEIDKWTRDHPDQKPTIAIDFLSLTRWVQKNVDSICGGRYKMAMEDWRQKLELLKSMGCLLVFFSDLKIEESKIEEKLRRCNENFTNFAQLYELIENGKTLEEIVAEKTDLKELTGQYSGLRKIAQMFGEFHNAVGRDCDLELVKYATEQNVMAIISEDTDFLIFDGPWKLWSPHNIHIDASNRIKISEYNRNPIQNVLKLTHSQLPLFASLLGNDFTRRYYGELCKTFGGWKHRFYNVAQYIQEMHKKSWRSIDYAHLTDWQISSISEYVLNVSDVEFQRQIKHSLASYDVDAPHLAMNDDPIARILFGTSSNMYRAYMKSVMGVQSLTTVYYDMHDFDFGETFMKLKLDWKIKRIGVMRQHIRNGSFETTMLMKRTKDEQFMAYQMEPIYPDFPIPPLDRLYLEAETDDMEMNGIKWKIFAWLMSFSEGEIATLKKLPKDYLQISTTLHTLVKNCLITIDEADGILYTEKEVYSGATMDVDYPTHLVTRNIRIAHTYQNFVKMIRSNFKTAGLSSFIQDLQFDGVYFQKRMETIITSEELAEIADYRIYV